MSIDVRLAREVIDEFDFPTNIERWDGEPLTAAMVADTFRWMLRGRLTPITDESTLPLGVSKLRGCPQLPTGLAWPEGSYFQAQLNLAELAAFGLWDFLPPAGILYLFFDPSRADFQPFSPSAARALLYDGDLAKLECHPFPDRASLPYGGRYYYKHFAQESQRVSFEPVFSLGYTDLVPRPLIAALEAALKVPYTEDPYGIIGGQPTNYQSEEEDEMFASEDWDWTQGPPSDPNRFLLLQDHFGEGHLHFWVYRDRVARGDLSVVHTTYSGT